jgi:hypothetical protein
MEAVFDDTNHYWTVVVTGTDFSGTLDTTELNVNGRIQETVILTDTEAVFRVTDITGWTLNNINLYFEVGNPKGFDTVI